MYAQLSRVFCVFFYMRAPVMQWKYEMKFTNYVENFFHNGTFNGWKQSEKQFAST